MVIVRFEDLDCWKAARALVRLVYGLTLTNPFARDFGLRDQIQKAAISVMANIAEGFGTVSNAEFVRFLGFSLRSAIEVQSHLYAARDLAYIDDENFEKCYVGAQDCVNLCKGFIKYLKES
ncbi:MAG: four helix bundle protein [Deltaproteobacteria bacterium]|nr:four helix bundle protein [Deltaproteobacteria bacterium]